MPFSSSQISELIGGQQVMFANNAQFAHQVGAVAGTMPPQSGMGGMNAPSFGRSGYGGQDLYFWERNTPGGYGASMVGGMGGALPGLASGLGLAGGLGLLGGAAQSAAGMFDPFAGFARGVGGTGFFNSLGMVGRGFATGGVAGGAGALGAGLAGAALPLAGMYALGRGVEFTGQALYQGAQDVSRMGGMAQQFFGPQFGTPGMRPGGGMARGQIQGLVDTLHEIVGEETMATMSGLQRMVEQAGRMGMLGGITNAEQFKQKFRSVVAQTKEVAKILGTSLEEAMPVIGQFQQMGLWRPQDIMGGALALKMAGPQAAPQMMAAMQVGAQRSWAMGGSLAAGAALGRQQFANIQSAVQTGVLTNEMVTEMTGGTGGVEGQRMIAERMTEQLQTTTQTPVGRLTMAALGEVRNGRYTGRIDQQKLQALVSGKLTVGDLQRMGQGNTRTREGAASFTFREGQIGQELMAQGGMEAQAAMYQAGLERAGFGGASEEIQGLMLQKMFGLQTRDAMMVQRLMKELPTITERRKRRELDALKDAFRQAEERQNRSWEGFKDAMNRTIEVGLEDPLRHFASRLTTSANESVDTLTDFIWGRKRQLDISMGERMRILARGGLGAAPPEMQNRLMSRSSQFIASAQTPYIERLREGGLGGLLGYDATRAGRLGFLGAPSRLGEVGDRVERLPGGGTVEPLGREPEIQVAGGRVVAVAAARAAIEQARRRADPSRRLAEDFKETSSTEADIAVVASAYRKVTFSPRTAGELAKKKKELSPEAYQLYLRQVISENDPAARDAFRRLHDARLDTGKTMTQTALDAIKYAQAKEGQHALEADFVRVAGRFNYASLARDPEELRRFVEEGTTTAYGALGTVRGTPWFGVTLDVGTGQESRYEELEGVSEKEFQTFMSTEAGEQLARFAAGDQQDISGPGFEKLQKAIREGDPTATAIFGRLGQMSKIQKKRFADAASRVAMAKGIKVTAEEATRRAEIAERELRGPAIGGLADATSQKYRQILEKYKTGDVEQMEEAARMTQELAAGLSEKEVAAFRGAEGGVAQQLAALGGAERLGGVGEERGAFMRRLQTAGLTSTLALAQEAFPEEYKRVFEGAFEEGPRGGTKLTGAEQADIVELLKKVARTGPQGAVQSEQERLVNEMTKFVGANEKFVLAVATAFPAISDVTVNQIRETMTRLADKPTEKP